MGFADAIKEPQKAVDVLVQSNPETDKTLETKGIDLLAPLWMNDVPAFGWQTNTRWQNISAWMKDRGILNEEVNESEAFTSEFVHN